MDFLESLRKRLKSKGVKNIVFPEYKEERFYYAAEKLLKEGLVKDIYFTGDEIYIKNKAKELKVNIDGIKIIPIEGSDYYKDFADEYFKLRESKGITKEEAYESMKNELYFGAMLVRKGIVDDGSWCYEYHSGCCQVCYKGYRDKRGCKYCFKFFCYGSSK